MIDKTALSLAIRTSDSNTLGPMLMEIASIVCVREKGAIDIDDPDDLCSTLCLHLWTLISDGKVDPKLNPFGYLFLAAKRYLWRTQRLAVGKKRAARRWRGAECLSQLNEQSHRPDRQTADDAYFNTEEE